MATPSFWTWIGGLIKPSAPTEPHHLDPAPIVAPRHDDPVGTVPAVAVVVVVEEKPKARPLAPPMSANKKTLAAVIGSVAGAAALFVLVPKEESGRTVIANVSQDGTATVTHVKGNQHLQAYRDIVGVVTICDGDTANVHMGQVATTAECTRRLEEQLINHAQPIVRCVPGLRGREYQVTAAVSLAYNIGTGGFCRSTAARRFNAGDWIGGCNAFLSWNKAGGRVVRGLDLRRHRELEVCLTGLVAGKTPENLQRRVGAVR